MHACFRNQVTVRMVFVRGRGSFNRRGGRPMRGSHKSGSSPASSRNHHTSSKEDLAPFTDTQVKKDEESADQHDGTIEAANDSPFLSKYETAVEDGPKFSGRCRLFVGSVPLHVKLDEFEALFKPFGETTEAYLSDGRGFGFIRLVKNTLVL